MKTAPASNSAVTLTVSTATDIVWQYSFNGQHWISFTPGDSKGLETCYMCQDRKGIADTSIGTVNFTTMTAIENSTSRRMSVRRTEFFDIVDWARITRGRDLMQGFALFAQTVEDIAVTLWRERHSEDAAAASASISASGARPGLTAEPVGPRRVTVRRQGPTGVILTEAPVFRREDFELLQQAYAIASRQSTRFPSMAPAAASSTQ